MQLTGNIEAKYELTGQVVATPTQDNKVANLVGTVSEKE